MNHVLAAACNTGTWQQKWSCGLHQAPGHSALWVLVGAVIGLVIIMRGRRGHREAMASTADRK